MPSSAQQLAAQKNSSYVLAEKLAQHVSKGEYEPGIALPGEIGLGEQSGVSRIAVREVVKTLTAKETVLPRPRIGTRVMLRSNRGPLDQELLTWWTTEENFHRVTDHSPVMRICLEPQTCLPATTVGIAERKAYLNMSVVGMVTPKRNFRRECWIRVDTAWHEHIYEMNASPSLTPFASLSHSVYRTYFMSITNDTVTKLDLHQAIVDMIVQSNDGVASKACQVLLRSPDKR